MMQRNIGSVLRRKAWRLGSAHFENRARHGTNVTLDNIIVLKLPYLRTKIHQLAKGKIRESSNQTLSNFL